MPQEHSQNQELKRGLNDGGDMTGTPNALKRSRDVVGHADPAQRLRNVPGMSVPTYADAVCPKCGARATRAATECLGCGLIFSKYRGLANDGMPGEIRLEGNPELANLWTNVIADYANDAVHESFIQACNNAGCLAYASQKYARVLVAAPQEDTARRMRKRIIALASFRAESGASNGALRFRIPGFNSLAMALASAAMTMGWMLPAARQLEGIGAAMLALTIGLRFFLRPEG